MRRGTSPAVPYSVRDPRTPSYFVVHRSHQPWIVEDIGESNAQGFGAALEVSRDNR